MSLSQIGSICKITNMSDHETIVMINAKCFSSRISFSSDQASKGHSGDVLAVRGDEGRGTLR